MKQLMTTARNIRHLISDEKVATEIEVVLGLSERVAKPYDAGVIMVRECTTVRFTLSPDTARELATTLIEYADEADEQSAKLHLKENPKF